MRKAERQPYAFTTADQLLADFFDERGINDAVVSESEKRRAKCYHWRSCLIETGRGTKAALGIMLDILGGLVARGFDKKAEALVVELSPQWLTEVTTKFCGLAKRALSDPDKALYRTTARRALCRRAFF